MAIASSGVIGIVLGAVGGLLVWQGTDSAATASVAGSAITGSSNVGSNLVQLAIRIVEREG